MEIVFVSYGYRNKLSQTCWLKTTQIYYLNSSKVRSPKSALLGQNENVFSAVFLLVGPGENLSPCLFQLLEAA